MNTQQLFGSYCVRLHGAKSLTVLKLCATTPNNTQMQQGVQTDATCNIHAVGELPCGSQRTAPTCVVWSWRLKECFALTADEPQYRRNSCS